MGFFQKPEEYSEQELLTINLVTLGHSITSLVTESGFETEDTYKYWDLFTWNLDTFVENNRLSATQANYILEATKQPFRNSFVLEFSPKSSVEDFIRKQTIAQSFFDHYLNEKPSGTLAGRANRFSLIDVPVFVRVFDFSWDRDPAYPGFNKVIGMYLAMVLNDTESAAKAERQQRRKSAFFWGSMFMTQWSERGFFSNK